METATPKKAKKLEAKKNIKRKGSQPQKGTTPQLPKKKKKVFLFPPTKWIALVGVTPS